MEDVARAAGVSRQGLYLLFSNKEELFRRAVEHFLSGQLNAALDVLDRKSNGLEERLVDACDEWAGRFIGTLGTDAADLMCAGTSLAGDTLKAYEVRFEKALADALADSPMAQVCKNAGLCTAEAARALHATARDGCGAHVLCTVESTGGLRDDSMTQRKTFGRRSTADHVLAGIDLTGKHFLVTGCNSGIGFATASALAANGAHVIAAARTHQKAAETCREIGYHCSPLECDLGDLESIAAAAESVRLLQVPLDGIVANAGVANVAAARVRYGVEQHFLVNHLGHFALVNDLAGVVRDATGRIVIVTSSAAGAGGADGIMFDNLDGLRSYETSVFYAHSKFANALYAKELSRRLLSRGIAVNSVNPGRVHGMGMRDNPSLARRLGRFAALPFRRTPAQGAAGIALLVASPSSTGISGEYWQDCAIARGNPLLNDHALATRLWETSEALIVAHRDSRPQSFPKAA